MVTLRRDVAAANNNTVFDRIDRDVELTDYDIFMRNRERSSAMGYGMESTVTSYDASSATATLGYHYEEVEEPKASSEYDSYDEYMRAQLNRDTVSKLLSKEEFYQARFESGNGAAVRAGKGRMTKAGKIFTAVYVLTVVVAALIMVIVNASAGGPKVSANADAATGEIQALEIESYEVEGNAFDDFLDKLSNK